MNRGDYIPKWKYENDIKNAVVENTTPEVSVNINGQRYEIIQKKRKSKRKINQKYREI